MSDLIDRQAAIDALDELCQEHRYRIPGKRETYSQYNEAWQDALGRAEGAIGNLPSAQPEYKLNEWCYDCKEYDQEHHCCPRFNRVIRTALQDAQPEPKWIPCSKRLPDDLEEVNITFTNLAPAPYYDFIKGKCFTGSAVFYKGEWYWYSSITVDVLKEYGRYESEKIDEGIKIVAWMPLPEPYRGEEK